MQGYAKRVVTLGLSVALGACVMVAEPPSKPGKGLANPPTPPVGTCGAEELQYLVGQPAAVLQTMRFGQVVRVIEPGMAVTMDYAPDRLNIELDKNDVISRISCG